MSPRSEFLIVIGLTFGVNFALFLVGLVQQGIQLRIRFDDARLLWLLAYEIVVGELLGAFLAAAVVFPLGIAFSIVYWRTRELWPLILTHGLIDLIGLLSIRAAGSS